MKSINYYTNDLNISVFLMINEIISFNKKKTKVVISILQKYILIHNIEFLVHHYPQRTKQVTVPCRRWQTWLLSCIWNAENLWQFNTTKMKLEFRSVNTFGDPFLITKLLCQRGHMSF